MKISLREYTIRDIVSGFVYDELEGKGLYGLDGRLTIQPEYQRNYIYADKKLDKNVIHSLLAGNPLGLFYFNVTDDGHLEVLDGQQRITSIGRYLTGHFAVEDHEGLGQYFSGLPAETQKNILDTTILVYECEGTEASLMEWFKTINTAGVPLNNQEILNAVYSGSFVTAGKAFFSNSENALTQVWANYVKGSPKRQDYWKVALSWISGGDDEISAYMSKHRHDTNITEVKNHFTNVIDWVKTNFQNQWNEMSSVHWGNLYNTYKDNTYDPELLDTRVSELYFDPYVTDKKGIWEFVLSGENSDLTHLLNVRVFDTKTKNDTYARQTAEAYEKNVSNCPLCTLSGNESTRTFVHPQKNMDADHVQAWSRGGVTSPANCQMLCSTHNKAKGNR